MQSRNRHQTKFDKRIRGSIKVDPPTIDFGSDPFTRFLEVVFAKQLIGWLILVTAVLIGGLLLQVPKVIVIGVGLSKSVQLYLQIFNYLGWVLMWNRWVFYGVKRSINDEEYVSYRNLLGVIVAVVGFVVFWQIGNIIPSIPNIPIEILLVFAGIQIFPFVLPNPVENGVTKLLFAIEIFLAVRAILFLIVG